MNLIRLQLQYREAFQRFYHDFLQHDAQNADYYRQGIDDFAAYIQHLDDEEQGINLKLDYVPCSHLWLIDDKQQIVGAIRIRHRIDNPFLSLEGGHIGYDVAPSFRGQGYGKQMLKLALPVAHDLGLDPVLITADEDNVASRRVIETNGGRLDNIVMGEVFTNLLARYWVKTSA
ncbi:GNAT family N-acetyltransferase [Vibrio hippocampi]|uniref:N-acetyltransferase domain-containing protein n=1 Tax=Vibrio hippocampi TaxID=654686 RepID=A0ABN8DHM3_9VIBR|nr:GNAT family N-acetyltransferase [Vibrio hippocampi]CAH0526023.1 hypothetical protein VHP8226_01507 [Vibrio hippocampi]